MSKHQFTDIRVAMLLLNRIILLYKGWNSNASNAVPVKQSAPIISVSAVPTISRRPEMCLSVSTAGSALMCARQTVLLKRLRLMK